MPIAKGTRLRITIEPITNPPNLKPVGDWTFYTADASRSSDDDEPAHELPRIEECSTDVCRQQMTLTNELLAEFASGSSVDFLAEDDALVSETSIHYVFAL